MLWALIPKKGKSIITVESPWGISCPEVGGRNGRQALARSEQFGEPGPVKSQEMERRPGLPAVSVTRGRGRPLSAVASVMVGAGGGIWENLHVLLG